jgi:leucyl-tRNA synthetase
LDPLVTMLAPFAPFTAEELWESLGHATTVCDARFPLFNEDYLKSDAITYPISINGRRRGEVEFATDADAKDIEVFVREMEVVKKWSETGIKKIIIVPGKMINVVV